MKIELELHYKEGLIEGKRSASPDWCQEDDFIVCHGILRDYFWDIDISKPLFLKLSDKPFEESYEFQMDVGGTHVCIPQSEGGREIYYIFSKAQEILILRDKWHVGVSQEEE